MMNVIVRVRARVFLLFNGVCVSYLGLYIILSPTREKKMISDSHKRPEKRKERVKCPRFKKPQINCALKGSSTGR